MADEYNQLNAQHHLLEQEMARRMQQMQEAKTEINYINGLLHPVQVDSPIGNQPDLPVNGNH